MIASRHDRDRRRRRRRRRRGGVDDPGAVGAAEAVARLPGRQRRPRSRRRWAGGWSTSGCRRSGPSRWARPTSSCASSSAISRERQDEFAARSHQLADAAWDDGLLRRPRRAGARAPTWPATRASAPARTAETLAGLQARRSAPTARSPPATPRRSTTAPPPCCSAPRRPRDRDRPRPARPHRRPRRARAASRRCSAIAPGRGGRAGARAGPASAGPTSARSSSTRPSPCSRWPASTPGSIDPRDRQRQGRRDRHRPPAGRLRRPDPRHPRAAAAASPASAGASRRSASASARRSPSCWRTSQVSVTMTVDLRRRRRGGRRHRGRLDRAGRRVRHGRHAGRPDRRADPAGRHRPDRGLQQRRQRRHRAGRAAGRRAGPQDDLLLPAPVRLLGLRRALPRRARSSSRWCRRATSPSGCARPAPASARSSARPASARRWPRARRPATIDGRDYVLEYPIQGDVALIGAHVGRPDGQPRLPQDRPQLRAGDGHRGRAPRSSQVSRGRRDRRARPGGRRDAGHLRRPRRRGAASEAAVTGLTDATVEHLDRGPLSQRRDGRARRPRHPAGLVRQPRHRPAHHWSPTTSTAELRRRAAHRERHARHGPGRASATRSTPTSPTPARSRSPSCPGRRTSTTPTRSR